MRTHRLVATVGVVALSLTTAACQSKSTSSASSTTASSAAAPSATAAAPAAPSSAAVSTAAPASAAPASAASGAASSAASAPSAASGSGAVTFDGDYSGKLTTIVCVGSGPTTTASFDAAFTGKPGTLTGDISSEEFGFLGPDNTQFDSGFLNKALDTDGKGFDVDGIVAKDESGKSVTMHGTLVCP
jgi:hypothetical protein